MSKFYVAYGSNLDMKQMALRCPGAKPVGSGFLKDYELIYRGSRTGSYASVRYHEKKYVPVGVWKVTKTHEKSLDRYEGYPVFYQKYVVPVDMADGSTLNAMIYIMRTDAVPGKPSDAYVDTIYRGYGDFGLDYRFLRESLDLNQKELRCRKH